MALVRLALYKFLYGAFFCIIVPAILVLWSQLFKTSLPPAPWHLLGWVLLACGLFLIGAGMWNLWRMGGGLPMNAFPPSSYVSRGSYAFFRHPIYTGFCIVVGGVSLITDSSTGLYVVTPVIILMCSALVYGYEKPDLERRFGVTHHPVYFGLPSNENTAALMAEKIAVWIAAFLPWILLYEIVVHIGVLPGSINTMLPFEHNFLVIEWMEIPYSLTYFFVGLVPFILRTRHELRKFVINAWLATTIGIFMYVVFPFHAEAREFEPSTFLGEGIKWEISLDGPAAAFPSFHVIWALIASVAWIRAFPRFTNLVASLTALMVISCAGVGVHSIADIAAGFLVVFAVVKGREILKISQAICERLANSWRFIRIGRLRVINHSLYAALAASTGLLVAALFSVPVHTITFVTVCSLVGGALWGQWLEGSSKLLRPFGYYGALIGGIVGVWISSIIYQESLMDTLAAFALASPLTQAIGRLRCLVQGCCHGRPTTGSGIRYVNPHSRVCRISGLQGKTIHNTQLYSIIANIVIFLLLLRIWYGGAFPSTIAGFYFVFSGIARFVEEAYRGESQTAYVTGLRLYQWLAILSLIAGIVITCLPTGGQVVFNPKPGTDAILVTLIGGLAWGFAMGMDFPNSKVPFSRLSD